LDEVHALFPDTAVTYRDNFNPFTAWRLDSMHVTTRYSLLMHNDVYFIDRGGILKMYSTMREQERRGYKVVVPMIYEREGNVSLSPHAVHDELHIDPTTSPPTLGHMMDLKKGLTRWEDQMEPGAQTHFLEDHAFMVLTDFVNCLIDPGSAYTMEYIDMYLNMMHEDGVKVREGPREGEQDERRMERGCRQHTGNYYYQKSSARRFAHSSPRFSHRSRTSNPRAGLSSGLGTTIYLSGIYRTWRGGGARSTHLGTIGTWRKNGRRSSSLLPRGTT